LFKLEQEITSLQASMNRPHRLAQLVFLFTVNVAVHAASFEVKIHDELIAPHLETSFEAEVKLYKPPSSTPVSAPVLLSRFEVARGITTSSEISINAFTSQLDGKVQFNGGKIAHIYIPEHDEAGWFHYGVKNEINTLYGLNEPSTVFYELTPIMAFRSASWRLTFNPSLDFYLNGERKNTFAPATKLAYSLFGNQTLGLECYSEWGPLRHPVAFNQRPDSAYVVWDFSTHASSWSVGVGRGVNAVGDQWVVKIIGSVPL
jgi:hypothetical protein